MDGYDDWDVCHIEKELPIYTVEYSDGEVEKARAFNDFEIADRFAMDKIERMTIEQIKKCLNHGYFRMQTDRNSPDYFYGIEGYLRDELEAIVEEHERLNEE